MKMVQVFLKGDTSAEVSGECVDYRIVPEGVWVTHKTEDSKDQMSHFFPHLNIQMIRFWTEK